LACHPDFLQTFDKHLKGSIMPESSSKTLAARPAPILIDPGHAAVIVVDMQNDFGATGGMFDRAGIDISGIRAAVPPTARVLAAARAAGIPVIYLQMQHRADLSDMGTPGSTHHQRHVRLAVGQSVTAPDGSPTRILIAGEWGTRIVEALAPEPADIIVPKHRFSGFFETPLHTILQGLGACQLIFTGCTTSICVESTIRDAMFRDYSCVLLEDCAAEPIGQDNSRSNHDASVLTIEVLLGWVSNSSDFIKALAN
jgi:ureidoacrylate peracid hydrolase